MGIHERSEPRGARRDGPRLCLAGSGGGHIRQLVDLEPVWRDMDYFFVTESSALGRSLAAKHHVRFVQHYALGQMRTGKTLAMLRGAVVNIVQSARIILSERPDVVVSTGAGTVFWTALFARLTGARFVMIESFARFDRPSKYARLAKRFASQVVVQSAPLKALWPDAHFFDPLRLLDAKPPPKQPLLFATVGATLPFDRMIDGVLALKRDGLVAERVIAQVGESKLKRDPAEGVEIVEALDFDDLQEVLKDADIVVCHGGTGSIITALRAGCRVIAMARDTSLGEGYDNHQEEIISAFAGRGLIEVANGAEDLLPAIERMRARTPILATTDPVGLISHLKALFSLWGRRERKRSGHVELAPSLASASARHEGIRKSRKEL